MGRPAGGLVAGHTLTVVDLQFSPSGRYLLATSRDRTWSVTEVAGADGQPAFRMLQRCEGHARIIWAGAWESDDAFVTVGRDCRLRRWARQGDEFVCCATLVFGVGATAVHVSGPLLAVGLESGEVLVHAWEAGAWGLRRTLCAGSGAITGLRWSPDAARLATASKDRSVRVFVF